MVGIDAPLVAAQVVKRESFGNGPPVHLVRDTVSGGVAKPAIAIRRACPDPFPTAILADHIAHRPRLGLSGMLIEVDKGADHSS